MLLTQEKTRAKTLPTRVARWLEKVVAQELWQSHDVHGAVCHRVSDALCQVGTVEDAEKEVLTSMHRYQDSLKTE